MLGWSAKLADWWRRASLWARPRVSGRLSEAERLLERRLLADECRQRALAEWRPASLERCLLLLAPPVCCQSSVLVERQVGASRPPASRTELNTRSMCAISLW